MAPSRRLFVVYGAVQHVRHRSVRAAARPATSIAAPGTGACGNSHIYFVMPWGATDLLVVPLLA